MNKIYNEKFGSVMNELINYNLCWFGKTIGTDNWLVYKSCYHGFCIRQNEKSHLCWPGGRYCS